MLPLLTGALWPDSAYRRNELPERVLQFGSGMLLRALCAAAVDSANRSGGGARASRIVVVQSTAEGASRARALNAQDGLYTLVERGLSGGTPLERIGLVGAISRALAADSQWNVVRDVAANPSMQVIVSNVSEAGFRIDAPFPGRLTDALHARFMRAADAPPVFVIPTELVPDNGPRLAAMVHELAGRHDRPQAFRDWLKARVRFCSSLVDRIVTVPSPDQHERLEAQLGYRDALLTVAEPYALWAIEADPAELRAAFPIESASVVVAPDITFYRERKLRLLNALHTATTPLALLAGVRIVRDATTASAAQRVPKTAAVRGDHPRDRYPCGRSARVRARGARALRQSVARARVACHRDESGGQVSDPGGTAHRFPCAEAPARR